MEILFEQLCSAIVDMEEEEAAVLAEKIVSAGLDAADAIEQALIPGMDIVGELYEREEYFISELLSSADAFTSALNILKLHIKSDNFVSKGKIVIGSIFGDTHDIGKNIVAIMLESAGFEVLDLGRDVSARKFVDSATKFHADIIAMSTLMTTTMNNMRDVVELLEAENKREQFTVIIGGKPCSVAFAKKIGADDYSATAYSAVQLVRELCKKDML